MPQQCINGVSLYYEMAGTGAPLVFIHGLGSSARDWEWQATHFEDRYRVLRFDVRGHGRSSKPPGPYSIPRFAQDTAALLDALGMTPAHVVGVSMGGMVALQLAVDAPAMVRSLTVVNSMAEVSVDTLRRRIEFFGRKLFVRLFGMKAVGRVLGRRLFPEGGQEALRRAFAQRWARNDRRAYLAAIDAIVGWSITDHLSQIACPTLFLTADHDYTPVAAKHAMAAQMPDAEVQVIPNTRHALPVEHPRAFNAALEAFLERERVNGRTGAWEKG